jgi:RHS repeat-associated protein
VQQGGVFFVHEDPVTKSKRVTDTSGVVQSTVELDPYGADTARSSNSAFQPRKFTTYERDANGTDEAMARRYNRWHSRFDQPDPYDGSYDMTDPQSFNRYAYTHGDPVNYIDPTGMDDISGHEFCLNGECGDNEGYATSYGGGTSMSNGGSGGGRSYHPPLVGIGNDGTDGDTRAVNGAITMCSMGASIGEMSKVSNGMWRGRNGVMYPMRWGGNGATGGRSVAVGMAEELRFLGRAAGVGGMVLSTVQGVQAYRQGDNEGAAKSGVDLLMGGVGTFGGPLGGAAAGIYFGVDMTVGWKRVLTQSPRECSRAPYAFWNK